MTTASEIAGQLGLARERHGEFYCQCVLAGEHTNNDNHPSMRLRDGDDGKILVCCDSRHRNEQPRLVDALKARGLWPGSSNGTGRAHAYARKIPNADAKKPSSADSSAATAPSSEKGPRKSKIIWPIPPGLLDEEYRPKDPPKPPFDDGEVEDEAQSYPYYSPDYSEGLRVLAHIVRFRRRDNGKKEVRPLTAWDGKYGPRWHWKFPPSPRPLYNLRELQHYPAAPVLIVAGEKCADAANKIFPDRVAVTWMGGEGAVAVAQWATSDPKYQACNLKTRQTPITIWPDCDEAGVKAAIQIAKTLGAERVRIIVPHDDWRDKFDIADAIEEGTTREGLEAIIAKAVPLEEFEREVVERWPAALGAASAMREDAIPEAFWIKDDTLFVTRMTGFGLQDFKVCSKLEVIALTRDANGNSWGRLVRFTDPDGVVHEWSMPTEMLSGDGNEYRQRLLEQGLSIWSGREAVTRLGWHEYAFVLPGLADQGDGGERIIYQNASPVPHAFYERGTLADWQREVSARCVGNSRLILAISTAFAAPLLHLTNDESGGFHIVGDSSVGKTTALRVGGSVWGGSSEPLGFLRTWRATANALEGIAALHCDCLLTLDEIGQVAAREAGEVAYLLAQGQGKARARRDGSARAPVTWRLLFLSSGEVTLADKAREDGRHKVTAGQQVRVLDIPADAGVGLGLFENIHGAANPSEFADALRDATQKYYGTAARAFLKELMQRRDQVADSVRQARDNFIKEHLPDGADRQVSRAATRFGLVAAAGELATALGITGWENGTATEAAATCFAAWLKRRGHTGSAELEAGIQKVREFFQLHGESRFSSDQNDARGRVVLNRAGFRKGGDYCVFPEIFRSEIAAGFDWRALAEELANRGLLRRGTDGKIQRQVRNPEDGEGIRLICFTPAILGGEGLADAVD
jgi:putative DNA primase/helicase